MGRHEPPFQFPKDVRARTCPSPNRERASVVVDIMRGMCPVQRSKRAAAGVAWLDSSASAPRVAQGRAEYGTGVAFLVCARAKRGGRGVQRARYDGRTGRQACRLRGLPRYRTHNVGGAAYLGHALYFVADTQPVKERAEVFPREYVDGSGGGKRAVCKQAAGQPVVQIVAAVYAVGRAAVMLRLFSRINATPVGGRGGEQRRECDSVKAVEFRPVCNFNRGARVSFHNTRGAPARNSQSSATALRPEP
jgi:hypothetical protein